MIDSGFFPVESFWKIEYQKQVILLIKEKNKVYDLRKINNFVYKKALIRTFYTSFDY